MRYFVVVEAPGGRLAIAAESPEIPREEMPVASFASPIDLIRQIATACPGGVAMSRSELEDLGAVGRDALAAWERSDDSAWRDHNFAAEEETIRATVLEDEYRIGDCLSVEQNEHAKAMIRDSASVEIVGFLTRAAVFTESDEWGATINRRFEDERLAEVERFRDQLSAPAV